MESLRLLKAKEEGVEALRREIMRGVEDIEQGRATTHTTDAELEDFFQRLHIMEKARNGLDVADSEEAITQQESEERLSKWLSK